MTTDLPHLSIADAGRLIRTRQLSPVELIDALLRRIGELEPVTHAFITLTGGQAREQAKKAEQEIAKGGYRGPLGSREMTEQHSLVFTH